MEPAFIDDPRHVHQLPGNLNWFEIFIHNLNLRLNLLISVLNETYQKINVVGQIE